MTIGFLQIDKQFRAKQSSYKGSYKGIEEFSPKDPEVLKLSNNTDSKLKLSCIMTNIKNFEVKTLTM